MKFLHAVSIFLIVGSLLPLWNTGFWLVRGFDFPRLQLFVLALICFGLQIAFYKNNPASTIITLGLITTLGLDFYRIWPYTFLHQKESLPTDQKKRSLKVLTYNVRAKNNDYQKAKELFKKHDPDIIFLVETGKDWEKNLRDLKEEYPHHVLVPQDNTYGMLLYSKLEILEREVKFLVDDKVPSIHAKIKFKDGPSFMLFGVHPRPPRPKEGDSIQRDSELMKIAEAARDLKHVLVVGDFNDVAWSHTTRLFKRTSELLDPRVGRGLYNSFPTWNPVLRAPLDHFFHSETFYYNSFTRLPDSGSDHFPMLFTLDFAPKDDDQKPEDESKEDLQEMQELEARGKKWDGPNEEVSKEDD